MDADIRKVLPHRYPFLLVDKILEYVPGERAVGIKCITANEPQFTGHFPDRPIMPGVLQARRPTLARKLDCSYSMLYRFPICSFSMLHVTLMRVIFP